MIRHPPSVKASEIKLVEAVCTTELSERPLFRIGVSFRLSGVGWSEGNASPCQQIVHGLHEAVAVEEVQDVFSASAGHDSDDEADGV